jgi:hypothetical protein
VANYTGKGYFQKGNHASPGRKPRATELTYLQATLGSCPLPKWKRIVKRAVADAEAGDRHARRWLSDVLLGNAELAVLVERLNEQLKRLQLLESVGALGVSDAEGAAEASKPALEYGHRNGQQR